MTTYNKYGQPVQCLGAAGPCEEVCDRCIAATEISFERDVSAKVRECKRYLEHCGFEVKETEFIPWDWIRGI